LFTKWSRHGLLLVLFVLFSAGCAQTQAGTQKTNAVALEPTYAPTEAAIAVPAAAAKVTPTAALANTDAGSSLIRLDLVPEKSEARYRVREQLVNLSLPSDAVGATKQITGTIVGKTDGTIVSSESQFVVDLRTLQSDRSMRDNFLRRNVLETDKYPFATFVPKQAEGLDLTLAPTHPTAFKLTGDLTIRNVTKPVTWDVTCQPQGDTGTCHATTSFQFEYFGLTQPRVSVVLSIVDHIALEVDMVLQRVGG
jgi:polyisoprenoid-binding protein YceI